MSQYLKLCLVTHRQQIPFHQYKDLISQAILGGVTCVQLREKHCEINELYAIAKELKQLLDLYKIPLIINDHVEIAKEIDAAGVHVGQSDLSPFKARSQLGLHKIIGWSVETWDELVIANQLTCIDYIAASAVFPSKTKSDCKTLWGIEGLKKMTLASKYPVVGIGGIESHNVDKVIESGARGVAVVGAIHDALHPKNAAMDLINKIDGVLERSETNVRTSKISAE